MHVNRYSTTNLQLGCSLFGIGENIEFEEKAESHIRSYRDPHHVGTEGLERREKSRSRRNHGQPWRSR